MPNDWYSPSAIEKAYSQAMVKWLIPILPVLRDGLYPPNPKESGYVDPASKQHRVNAKASFQKAADIAAELDKRITNAGADGLILEFYYSADDADLKFRAEHIATALNVSVQEISQRIRDALYFVSGQNRKAGSYQAYIENSRQHGRGSYRRR